MLERPQHMHRNERFVGLRVPKPRSLRGKALRWLGGFLLLMLVFTLLSRAADELTIPHATLSRTKSGSIDRKITGYGKTEELSALPVTAYPGVRVSGVAVKEGSRVEAGEVLFTLDSTHVEELLHAAQEELDQLDMDLSDQAGREELAAQDRTTALTRAQQDYAAAQLAANREVGEAQKAWEAAKSALESYTPPPAPDLSALEKEVQTCTERRNAAQAELQALTEETEAAIEKARAAALESGEDPDAAAEAVRKERQPLLDAAKEKLLPLETALTEAETALREAQKQTPSPDGRETLRQAEEQARRAYDQAVTNRDNSLRQAQRAVEDAQRPSAPDSSGRKAQLLRDAQAKRVTELQALLDGGSVVRAPESGTVTGISVSAGMPTSDGTSILLSTGGSGTVFVAQISEDQEKYISPGDPVTLKPAGDTQETTGLTVESVGKSTLEGLLDVTVRLAGEELPIGAAAELQCLHKSQEYPACVPLSALHQDGDSTYLLVPETVQTILGPQTTATRIDVEVIEKNSIRAALEGERDRDYLAYSDKPINPGDRIRTSGSSRSAAS